MKTLSLRNTRASRSSVAGFSLIELLVVISIIAALAALTTVGVQAAMRRAKRADSITRIKMIENCLEAYKNDSGEFPIPSSSSTAGTFLGQSYRIGGAACVYQAISGDGNDQILGYKVRGDEQRGPSNGEFASTKGTVYMQDANVQRSQWFVKNNGLWLIVDGFKTPFQYFPKGGTKTATNLHNELTFDLWSYGAQARPSDDGDIQSSKEWDTNWK